MRDQCELLSIWYVVFAHRRTRLNISILHQWIDRNRDPPDDVIQNEFRRWRRRADTQMIDIVCNHSFISIRMDVKPQQLNTIYNTPKEMWGISGTFRSSIHTGCMKVREQYLFWRSERNQLYHLYWISVFKKRREKKSHELDECRTDSNDRSFLKSHVASGVPLTNAIGLD